MKLQGRQGEKTRGETEASEPGAQYPRTALPGRTFTSGRVNVHLSPGPFRQIKELSILTSGEPSNFLRRRHSQNAFDHALRQPVQFPLAAKYEGLIRHRDKTETIKKTTKRRVSN